MRMSYDVGEVMERLENEQSFILQSLPSLHLPVCHSSFYNPSTVSPTSKLILQTLLCFAYIKLHSTTLLLLHLHQSSFYNPSVVSPTLQLILQPFFRFSYITGSSLISPGDLPMSSFKIRNLNLRNLKILQLSSAKPDSFKGH